MHLRILAAILMTIWLLLILLGKKGFVHLLILITVIVIVIDIVSVYRGRMRG